MDDLSQQVDEIEALVAIYGDEWQTDDEENRAYSINIGKKEQSVKLYIKLPKNYPSISSPIFEISAPHLDLSHKIHIINLLNEVCTANAGQNVIFQLIERVREVLDSDLKTLYGTETKNELQLDINKVTTESTATKLQPAKDSECLEIIHGDVIVDRKSSFQGHVAVVMSLMQVKQVLHSLYENKKIKQATHNMYAYRIYREETKTFVQDCEDDGEGQAGGRLLHLLQIIDVKNVLIVVTRWYGGIHLGSDRFRHINNAARQVITAANLIPHKPKKKM